VRLAFVAYPFVPMLLLFAFSLASEREDGFPVVLRNIDAAKDEREREYRSREKTSPDHQCFLPDQRAFARALRKKRANNDASMRDGKTSGGSAE
jgi:hypothetical protein